MKRRQLLRYAGTAAIASVGSSLWSSWQPLAAQTSGVTIKWLGHTCFFFTGGGQRILTNPFLPIGCTNGYPAPRETADLVMISSRLLDEGLVDNLPGNPRILSESGIFQLQGLQIQGVPVAHDRENGRRFGTNIIWRWNQGGLNLVHLGGAAAPLEFEQQVLLGRPDVLFVPVGGSAKAYNPEEAQAVIQRLNPKFIVPTHYRTNAADDRCQGDYALSPVEAFLAVMGNTPVQRVNGTTMTLQANNLPSSSRILLFSSPV